jgi:hypothetical protein
MRRRVAITLIVFGAVVVGGAVVADNSARAFAENLIATEVKSSLPSNVSGDVNVSVGGFSFVNQYLSGRLDEVRITSSALMIQGVPVTASVVATGVPTDLSQPVDAIDATLGLSEAAVNQAAQVPGAGSLTLLDGSVSYTGALNVLGMSLSYTVRASVAPSAGNVVMLTPQEVTLAAGAGSLDLTGVLGGVKDTAVPICLASYLPQDLTISGVTVTSGSADVVLSGRNIVLSQENLSTLGSCT